MKKRMIFLGMVSAMTLLGAATALADPQVLEIGVNLPTGDMAPSVAPNAVQEVSEEEVDRMDRAMRAYTGSSSGVEVISNDNPYYYSMLSPEIRDIYDCILMVAEDPVSEDNINLILTETEPGSEEFYYQLFTAYAALTYDHPEYFWLYNFSEAGIGIYSPGIALDGMYPVYIGMTEPYAAYEEKMTAFNQATEEFMADIDLNASEYSIAKQIHDKLIETVTYAMYVCDSEAEGTNLAHTAYGALVADSRGTSHYAVCDGYSLAYEYLLGRAGIDSVFLAGMAGSSDNAGGHAWNMVKLDGEWYEVDCTWDDAGTKDEIYTPDIDGYEYIREALEDPDYREKIQHYLFTVSTDKMTNFEPDESYYYITKDMSCMLSLVGSSFHSRFEGSEYGVDGAIIPLAPLATASWQ